jgi:hypothetical protein
MSRPRLHPDAEVEYVEPLEIERAMAHRTG